MSSPSDQPGASDTALTALSALPPDTPGANSRNFLTSCFFLERETVGNFCELGCNYFITNMSCLSSVSCKEAELAPQSLTPSKMAFGIALGWASSFFF